MSEDPPPQFGLRTLLLATTVFAGLCSLVALFGLTGALGAIMIVVILATGVGTFVGLLICSYAGLGFGFEDLRWEVLKCLALGTIAILSAYGLFSLAEASPILLVIPILMAVCMKLFWQDLEAIEMVIVGFSALCGTSIAAGLTSHWFGG